MSQSRFGVPSILKRLPILHARTGTVTGPPPLPGSWQCDLATEQLTWSSGVFGLFGIDLGTPLDRRDVLTLYTPDSRDLLERVRSNAIARCGSFTIETEIYRLDGETRWIRIVADVARGAAGHPVLLYGTKQDVTDEIAAGRAPFTG